MQGGEKHFVKTVPGSGTPVSSSIINPGNSQTRPVASTTGSVQIAARTVSQITAIPLTSAGSIITASSSGNINHQILRNHYFPLYLSSFRWDSSCFLWRCEEYHTPFKRHLNWKGWVYSLRMAVRFTNVCWIRFLSKALLYSLKCRYLLLEPKLVLLNHLLRPELVLVRIFFSFYDSFDFDFEFPFISSY